MEKKDAIFELPLADGWVGYVIPNILPKNKNYDVPDQPLGWQGTIEHPPMFEPMEEEEREKREEKREEEEVGEGEEEEEEERREEMTRDSEEEEIEAESDYLDEPGDQSHLVTVEEMKEEKKEEEIESDIYADPEDENNSEEEEGEKEEGAYGEYFVVSEKMEEGRIETQVEEAAQELAEFSQHTYDIDTEEDYGAHEWLEIQDFEKENE